MEAAVLRVMSLSGPTGAPVVRVHASGELDLANAPLLRQQLAVATARESARVDVDFTEVTFFDCAALHALEDADVTAAGRLRLVATSRPVRLVLTALGMQQRFRTA